MFDIKTHRNSCLSYILLQCPTNIIQSRITCCASVVLFLRRRRRIVNLQGKAVTWRVAWPSTWIALHRLVSGSASRHAKYVQWKTMRRCKDNDANIVKTALSGHEGGCWLVQSWFMADGDLGSGVGVCYTVVSLHSSSGCPLCSSNLNINFLDPHFYYKLSAETRYISIAAIGIFLASGTFWLSFVVRYKAPCPATAVQRQVFHKSSQIRSVW